MSRVLSEADKRRFSEEGYLIVENLLSREVLERVRCRADLILARHASHIANSQIVSRFSGTEKPVLHKVRELVNTDDVFRELAGKATVVDVIEDLFEEQALIFRDVLVVKPARDGTLLHWHQDSAYWDVEPPALVSAWIPLDDVLENAGCLRVIRGSHKALVEHSLFIGERKRLPRPVTGLLRKFASLAGTGDNPRGTGGTQAMDYLKRLVLAKGSRFMPALSRLNDFRVTDDQVLKLHLDELALPVNAGSVIFFHSLLLHASNPNTSDNDRYAAIISYMSRSSRFTGRGKANFLQARASAVD